MPNLFDTFVTQVEMGNPIYSESVSHLHEVFETLIKFRAPHKRVADDNFKLRAGDAVGSGGHGVDILQSLINETFTRKLQLKEMI